MIDEAPLKPQDRRKANTPAFATVSKSTTFGSYLLSLELYHDDMVMLCYYFAKLGCPSKASLNNSPQLC